MRYLFGAILLCVCSSALLAQVKIVTQQAPLQPLEPDVYSSQLAASVALAGQVAKGIGQFTWSGDTIQVWSGDTIQVTGPSATVNEPWVERFISSLQRQFPNAHILREAPSSPPAEMIVLAVSSRIHQPRNQGVHRRDSGELTAQLSGSVSGTLSSRYMEIPWADDLAGFINSQVDKGWIVGQSDRLCSSESEAEHMAVRDAARQLLPYVRNRMNSATFSLAPQEALIELIAQNLSDAGITDRFVQRFDRPYGSLWQQSVLVTLANPSLGLLSNRVASALKSRQSSVAMTWVSTVAFFAVIVLLYWFLNAATKGYFTWRLRFGAVLMLAMWLVLLAFGGLFYLKLQAVQRVAQPPPRIQLDRTR